MMPSRETLSPSRDRATLLRLGRCDIKRERYLIPSQIYLLNNFHLSRRNKTSVGIVFSKLSRLELIILERKYAIKPRV